MDNIVSLGSDRPRPRRALGVPRTGARILFFTGVRYCRDDEPAPCRVTPDHRAPAHSAPPEHVMLLLTGSNSEKASLSDWG